MDPRDSRPRHVHAPLAAPVPARSTISRSHFGRSRRRSKVTPLFDVLPCPYGSVVWEPLLAGVAWTSPPLFNLSLRRVDVVSALGEPHATDLDSNGVGLFDAWALRFPCGLEITVWLFRDDRPAPVEIHANDRDFDHIRFHLPLPAAGASRWVPDTLVDAPREWVVLRQDDGGCRYEVNAFSSECEAREVARAFEERGHKQMYWVERRERAVE